CNLGIGRLGDADYIGLLNNDAFVEPGWLPDLVAVLEEDPAVGAASSKVLFATPFVELQLQTRAAAPGRGDRRRLGVRVSGSRVDGEDVWGRTQLVRGFWGREPDRGEPEGQWSSDRALLRVPVGSDGTAPAACELRLERRRRASVEALPRRRRPLRRALLPLLRGLRPVLARTVGRVALRVRPPVGRPPRPRGGDGPGLAAAAALRRAQPPPCPDEE